MWKKENLSHRNTRHSAENKRGKTGDIKIMSRNCTGMRYYKAIYSVLYIIYSTV